jgi:hypothetical protein
VRKENRKLRLAEFAIVCVSDIAFYFYNSLSREISNYSSMTYSHSWPAAVFCRPAQAAHMQLGSILYALPASVIELKISLVPLFLTFLPRFKARDNMPHRGQPCPFKRFFGGIS